MLYKRRIVQLRSFATNAPVYVLAAICSTLVLVNWYGPALRFYDHLLPDYRSYRTIVFAVAFSAFTMLLCSLLRSLMGNLLLKSSEEQEEEVRQFSVAVNRTLHLEELLGLYRDFLQQNLPGQVARVFLKDPATGCYRMQGSTEMALANRDALPADHPLVQLLQQTGHGITYSEFSRTRGFRAMWQQERSRLEEMDVTMILPVLSGSEMVAITLVSGQGQGRAHRHASLTGQMSFLESTAAVLAIALKNAILYEALEKKAQHDPLTNLYNRGYFQDHIREEFEQCRHGQLSLLLISFDDFRLYNELYGSGEGDLILQRFAQALSSLADGRGTVARYSGREFAVSFPFGSAADAVAYAEQARRWLNEEILRSGEKTPQVPDLQRRRQQLPRLRRHGGGTVHLCQYGGVFRQDQRQEQDHPLQEGERGQADRPQPEIQTGPGGKLCLHDLRPDRGHRRQGPLHLLPLEPCGRVCRRPRRSAAAG